MSYYVQSNTSRLHCDLTDLNLAYPLTMACWSHFSAQTTGGDYAVMLGTTLGTISDSLAIMSGSTTLGTYLARATNTTPSTYSALTTSSETGFTGYWLPIVVVHAGASSRKVYVHQRTYAGNVTNTSTASPDITVGDLRYLAIGASLAGTAGWNVSDANYGRIGEVAIWTTELSDANIDLYMGTGYGSGNESGTAASSIDSANLLCYYPLKDSGDLADYSGNARPTLSTTGTVTHDSIHPTITSGSANKGRLLMLANQMRAY